MDAGRDLPTHLPTFHAVAQQTVDARIGVLLDALEADLAGMGRDEEHLRRLMVQAVDERRDADLRRFAVVVDTLARLQERETRRAMRFQDEIMTWRSSVDAQLAKTGGDQQTKEES